MIYFTFGECIVTAAFSQTNTGLTHCFGSCKTVELPGYFQLISKMEEKSPACWSYVSFWSGICYSFLSPVALILLTELMFFAFNILSMHFLL